MNSYLPLVVGGVANGSVVAIAAMGLVLSFRASGVFNFAHGAIGAAAAGLFYQLHVLNGLPTWLSLIITLVVVGGGFGLVMERVAAAIATASTTMRVVATVGVMISVTALFTLRFGGTKKSFPPFLPQGTFRLGGVNIGWDQLVVVVIGLVLAAGMTVVFRRSRLGRSMRAVVDDPTLVALIGTSPTAVRRWAWVIGTTFAAVAGVLIAPSLGLDGTSLTLLVVESFGAAAVGGFASLPLTYVGAVAIQVAIAVTTKWTSGSSTWQSLPSVIPFLVLFLVLVVTPKRRLIEVGASLQQRLPSLPRRSPVNNALRLLPVVALVAIVPFVFEGHLLTWVRGFVFVILMMSLSLLVRTSNQISLCQMGFAAVGAVAAYRVTEAGAPWIVGVLVGGLVAIPVGLVVAIPAIRLSGVYLALATLAFGILLESVAYDTPLMFGSDAVPLFSSRPTFADGDLGYYGVVVAVVALCYVLVRVLERARLGQLLRAKADSPTAVESLGVTVWVLPAIAFCVAAFLAGIAGSLIGPIFGVVGRGDFPTLPTSVMLVALLVLGARSPGIGTLGASVIGAVSLIVIPDYIQSSTVLSLLNLLFGVAALEAAIASTRTSSSRRRRRADRVDGSTLAPPPTSDGTTTPVLAAAVGGGSSER